MSEVLEKMASALIEGKESEVKALTQEALDNGFGAKDILDNGLLAGMDVVGRRGELLLLVHTGEAFEFGEVFVDIRRYDIEVKAAGGPGSSPPAGAAAGAAQTTRLRPLALA